MEQTKWLWFSDQGDDDLPVGQVGQVTPSARQDPADPGDKTQQIVSSYTCIHDEAERVWNTKYKSKLKGEREGKKQRERDNKYCARVRVCLCVWAQLVLHVVTTETVPAHVCVCVCYVFVSLPLCRLAKPPVPRLHLWSPGKWLIWKYNHSGQDFISSLSDSLALSPTLSIALISFTTDKFSVSRSTLAFSLFRSLSRSHQNSQLLSSPSSPLLSFCCLTQLP